jgi:hypothetical protein
MFGGLPQLADGLNSPDIDAGAVLSHNGLEIIFHSNRLGVGGRDLWTATRKSVFEPWSAPTNMGSLNTTAEEWFPALSADDDTLYFVSNRPGTQGGNDIYMTTRNTHGKR